MNALTTSALTFAVVLAASACERKATPLVSPDPVPVPSPLAREGSKGAGSAAAPAPGGDAGDGHPHFAKVEFPEVPIRAGTTTTVKVSWKAPDGTGVNEDAPFRVRWDRSDALAEAPADVKATGSSARDGFRIAVKPLDGAPNATLGGVIDLVVCDVATHSVCVPVRRKVEIEFVVGKSAAAETTVTVELPQARAL